MFVTQLFFCLFHSWVTCTDSSLVCPFYHTPSILTGNNGKISAVNEKILDALETLILEEPVSSVKEMNSRSQGHAAP